VIAVVLLLGFRIFVPVVVSIVKSVRMMAMMLLVMRTTWAMALPLHVASVKKIGCSGMNTAETGGSHVSADPIGSRAMW
jgi:hypothetical protein